MIVSNLEEIKNIQFQKVEDNDTYLKNLYKAFLDLHESMKKNKDVLAKLQASESGKPIKYCQIEIERCIEQLNQAITYIQCYNYDVDEKEKIKKSKRISIGIVLGITTFSSPYSSFFHKIIPSLICGNMFVFVPSPKVCRCSKELFCLLEQSMKKYLTKMKERLFFVNTALIDAKDVISRLKFNYILFTGKSETAFLIKQQIGYQHGTFETGSNAMAYVDKKIDNLEDLAQSLVHAAFAQSGMRCIALKNLFIHKEISEKLIERVIFYARKILIGNPLDKNVIVGPIYDSSMLSKLINNITILKTSGYQVLLGGYIYDNNILLPTILLDLSREILSIQEMYGPILCIHVVKNFEEIDEKYYKRSSLNTAFFSKDLDEVNRFIEFCDTCGTICINCGPDRRDDNAPFGGLFDENDGKEDLETLIKNLSIEQKIQTY